MLTNENAAPTATGHCRYLRCKEMFIDTGKDFHISQSGSGIYWCSHTQTCIGPDGQVVGFDACLSGRECHEQA